MNHTDKLLHEGSSGGAAGKPAASRDDGNGRPPREQARRLLHAGGLPNRAPQRTWGGPGSGLACAICSGVVRRDQAEIEIEFDAADEAAPAHTYRAHAECFTVWEGERRRAEAGNGSASGNRPPASRPS